MGRTTYYKLPQRVIIVEMKNIEIDIRIVCVIVFAVMFIFFDITCQKYYFYNNKKTNRSVLRNW
jgi:hypothetical protein